MELKHKKLDQEDIKVNPEKTMKLGYQIKVYSLKGTVSDVIKSQIEKLGTVVWKA